MDLAYTRDDLLVIIRENRQEHRAIFEEALKGYKEELLQLAENRVEELRRGKRANFTKLVQMPEPKDHTKDYDAAIKMLELTTEEKIVLTEYQFRQLVMDEWDWKEAFVNTTSMYNKKF